MASELVRIRTIVGTEAEIHNWLWHAERRGVLRGHAFAVARLRDGRVALKVHMISSGPRAAAPTARRSTGWPMSTRHTVIASVALIGVAVAGALAWLIVHTALAAAEALARNPGPVIVVLLVLALLALRGGGGGTFSGTFKGTFR